MPVTREWIETHASQMAAVAERETEALVAVSSPSGDAAAAEQIVAVASALAPAAARVERLPCSTPEHAPDLLISVDGPGELKILLVGHSRGGTAAVDVANRSLAGTKPYRIASVMTLASTEAGTALARLPLAVVLSE